MRILLLLFVLFPLVGTAESSKCYGTTSNGSLSNGVKLPQGGKNYIGYSLAASIAGRTYVHSEVRKIIVAPTSRCRASSRIRYISMRKQG